MRIKIKILHELSNKTHYFKRKLKNLAARLDHKVAQLVLEDWK